MLTTAAQGRLSLPIKHRREIRVRVREILDEKYKTTKEMQRAIGVGRVTLNKWFDAKETGGIDLPWLFLIAEETGASLNYLIRGLGPKYMNQEASYLELSGQLAKYVTERVAEKTGIAEDVLEGDGDRLLAQAVKRTVKAVERHLRLIRTIQPLRDAADRARTMLQTVRERWPQLSRDTNSALSNEIVQFVEGALTNGLHLGMPDVPRIPAVWLFRAQAPQTFEELVRVDDRIDRFYGAVFVADPISFRVATGKAPPGWEDE